MTVYNLTKLIVFLLSNFSKAMEKQLQVLQYFLFRMQDEIAFCIFQKALHEICLPLNI